MNVDGFRADVLREPETLAALVDAYLAPGGPLDGVDGRLEGARRVLFTGMGSSRFAALSAARWLRAAGVDAHVEYASATVALPPSPETLVIAISASGASEETVAALERHAGTSPTVAVTNHPERTLGHGRRRRAAAARRRGGRRHRLRELPVHPGGAAPARRAGRRSAGARGGAARRGRGRRCTCGTRAPAGCRRRSSCWTGATRSTSSGPTTGSPPSSSPRSCCARRRGCAPPGCETGDWLHVDVYLSRHPGYRALLLAGSPYDAGVMDWARKRDSTIVAVGRPVDGSRLDVTYPRAHEPLVALLTDTMVAELVAADLWQRRGGA